MLGRSNSKDAKAEREILNVNAEKFFTCHVRCSKLYVLEKISREGLVLKDTRITQLLYSAHIGDGCYVKNSTGEKFGYVSYCLNYISYDLRYLTYKRDLFITNGFSCSNYRITCSGYKKNSFGFNFSVRSFGELNKVGAMSKIDVISRLNKFGLIIYYLDDGSYHQKRNFGHLYCNDFTPEEVDSLVEKVYELYPIKKCAIRLDRKKDGREYPYLYIPVSTMKVFKEDVFSFLKRNRLNSLYYKAGLPSQTIENLR